MNKGLEALERLHEFAWSNEEYRNDIDNTDYQIIEKELKRLEELEKAFDALSKDYEKVMKELSKEIEKNMALKILRECNLTIDEFNKKFDFISGKVPKDKVDLLKDALVMSEMEKLQKWLDKNNIKYERYIEDGKLNRNQILIKTDNIELSFICHFGSYGYEQGLIEMYDFNNDPIGYLTAKQCISKLKEVLL